MTTLYITIGILAALLLIAIGAIIWLICLVANFIDEIGKGLFGG